jgi:tripartite-type tricarboxylate transporter receptor subunit TctC
VLLAPVGTPEAIIRKASADLRKALDDQDIKTKLASLGAYLRPMSPAEVTAFSQEQQKIWRPIAEHVANEAQAK